MIHSSPNHKASWVLDAMTVRIMVSIEGDHVERGPSEVVDQSISCNKVWQSRERPTGC
jgi:hypothetical protein